MKTATASNRSNRLKLQKTWSQSITPAYKRRKPAKVKHKWRSNKLQLNYSANLTCTTTRRTGPANELDDVINNAYLRLRHSYLFWSSTTETTNKISSCCELRRRWLTQCTTICRHGSLYKRIHSLQKLVITGSVNQRLQTTYRARRNVTQFRSLLKLRTLKLSSSEYAAYWLNDWCEVYSIQVKIVRHRPTVGFSSSNYVRFRYWLQLSPHICVHR